VESEKGNEMKKLILLIFYLLIMAFFSLFSGRDDYSSKREPTERKQAVSIHSILPNDLLS